MADNVNSVDYQLQVARQYGAPLDKTEVFTTYEDAVAYARGGIAYAGQLISVVNGEAVNIYKIMSDRTLVAMDAKSITMSNELPKPNGVARAGTSGDPARGDHVHPHDDSKLDKSGDRMTGALYIEGIDEENLSLYAAGFIDGDEVYEGGARVYSPNNLADKMKSNTDNRNVATIPNDYNGVFKIAGLKYGGSIGLGDKVSGYCCLMGVRGWADDSGGNSHEFALAGNGKIYHRSGATTSWNSWELMGSTLDNYPVGAIYISVNRTSPAELFGGSWEEINSQAYLRSTSSGTPGMYVNAGLPNIIGYFYAASYDSTNPTDAFQYQSQTNCTLGTSGGSRVKFIKFNAGAYSSIYGNSTTVTPYSLQVKMWKRTA